MIVPITVINLPMINNSGPIAATINPILTIICCVSGDNEFNLSVTPCNLSTSQSILGFKLSHIVSPNSSSADLRLSTAPAVLLVIVSYISSNAPLEFCTSAVRLSQLSPRLPSSALKVLPCSFPAIML